MKATTQRTYDQIFQHPMTHNLEWRDIKSLFETMGTVEVEHNGNLKLSIGGHSAVFQSPTMSDVAKPEEVSHIRHLLQSAEKTESADTGANLLVVIDHKEARVYQAEMKGTTPQRVTPYDREGHKNHVHNAHDASGHDEQPHYEAFFAQVAKSLVGADKILIFGAGQGSSSAMDQFSAWTIEHRPLMAERIIATVVVDESHLTESQLLAKARDIYAREYDALPSMPKPT